MRIAIWLVVVCLAIAMVEGAKKPKGKGKPSKGKGKPSKPEGLGEEGGSGEEAGSGEEGGPGGQEPEPRGFCIDHMKVGAICMAGSSVVEKMLPAMDACAEECNGFERSSGVPVDMMRAKKPKGKGKPSKGKPSKGKGKPSKCPSASKIMDQAADKYA